MSKAKIKATRPYAINSTTLRSLAFARGISLRAFSNESGLPYGQVVRQFNGVEKPTAEFLQHASAILGLPKEQLVGDVEIRAPR